MQVGVDEAGGVIRVSDRKVAEPAEVTVVVSAIGRPPSVEKEQPFASADTNGTAAVSGGAAGP